MKDGLQVAVNGWILGHRIAVVRGHCAEGNGVRPVRRSTIHPTTETTTGEHVMNKSELIEHIAMQAEISKAAAARALNAMISGVKTGMKKDGSVAIAGFGTFTVKKRAARTGRNPRTGSTIKIRAARTPKFRPGKGLRDTLR
jgi:DNA-binding protein HU-beta